MAAVLVLNTPDDRRLRPKHIELLCRNQTPGQCCIKLVFHLTYTMMHGSTKLKLAGSRKRHNIFLFKLLIIKRPFLFSLQFLPETFLILRRTEKEVKKD